MITGYKSTEKERKNVMPTINSFQKGNEQLAKEIKKTNYTIDY